MELFTSTNTKNISDVAATDSHLVHTPWNPVVIASLTPSSVNYRGSCCSSRGKVARGERFRREDCPRWPVPVQTIP